jgi:Mrp family chromosome partitioning ATPase
MQTCSLSRQVATADAHDKAGCQHILLLLHLFLLLLLPLLLLLLQGDAPVVWRGPIVNNAIDRFLMGTSWGDLNVLVVDMPPGNVQRARGGGEMAADVPRSALQLRCYPL